MNRRDIFIEGIGAVSAGLITLNVAGVVWADNRRDMHVKSYDDAISTIDQSWKRNGPSKRFLKDAVHSYSSSISYKWPPGAARVAFRDNWILATAAYLDPLIQGAGLKSGDPLFGQFESFRYERALGRGFGICSQNALGLADLLNRRFNVDIRMVGLAGHVVTEARLPTGTRMVLDPSVDVFLPFGLDQAEKDPSAVAGAYSKTGNPDLAKAYDRGGNFVAPDAGSWGYSAKQYRKQNAIHYFERGSDLAVWLIPFCSLALGADLRRRQSKHVHTST